MNFIGIENINDLISRYATLKHPGVIHTEEQEASLEDIGAQARDILSQMNSFNFEGLPEDSSIKNNPEYLADLKRQIQDYLDGPDDYYLGLFAYPGIHYDSSNFILRYSGSRNSFLVGEGNQKDREITPESIEMEKIVNNIILASRESDTGIS
jgi:hypothetical protein